MKISSEAKKNLIFSDTRGEKNIVTLLKMATRLAMVEVLDPTFSSLFTKESGILILPLRNVFQRPEEHKLALTKIYINEVCGYLQKY